MSDIDCWNLASAVLPHSRRIMLYGPPGTGKTRLASVGHDNVYSITLTDDMPVAELRGHYIPKGNEYIWMDGPAIRAWREGARLVLNEIDHASPETRDFLHVILDDMQTARVTLPTSETVTPADGFHVIATMNGEPYDLVPAVLDRFPVRIHIDKVNEEALQLLPDELHDIVRITSDVDDEERRLSLRSWFEFVHLLSRMDREYAGMACFGDRWDDLRDAVKLRCAPAIDVKTDAPETPAVRYKTVKGMIGDMGDC